MLKARSKHYSLKVIAGELAAEVIGDDNVEISGLATLQEASQGELSFLANPTYLKYLATTGASAVILDSASAAQCPVPCVVVSNPYLSYAKVSALFDTSPITNAGIHPTATIHSTAIVDRTASIGSNVTISAGVNIGACAVIGANSVVGDDSIIGDNTVVHANVTIYHGISIGQSCIIHSGAVIGSDGFGFAKNQGEWIKINQLGGVVLGNRVEIGSCTTIDRGALDNTYLADGVKVDNQVQIAHNVRIGRNTAIAACVGIAGSTTIGEQCEIAGAAGDIGHLTITNNVHITAMTLVTKSIDKPGAYSSGTPLLSNKDWRKSAVRFGQLEALNRRVKELERTNNKLLERTDNKKPKG